MICCLSMAVSSFYKNSAFIEGGIPYWVHRRNRFVSIPEIKSNSHGDVSVTYYLLFFLFFLSEDSLEVLASPSSFSSSLGVPFRLLLPEVSQSLDEQPFFVNYDHSFLSYLEVSGASKAPRIFHL